MMEGRFSDPAGEDLNSILRGASLSLVSPAIKAKFQAYLTLLLHWNARINLTAIRDAAEIVNRHFVESIACAQSLPPGIVSLLDFGSGAGFPGIPVALCRPEIMVTLAESQSKKAAFLQEAVRTLGLNTRIWGRRAEDIGEQFDCVTLRAVDRMDVAVAAGAGLVKADGWLVVLTTLNRVRPAEGFEWGASIPLPGSDQRVIEIGKRGV